MFKVDELLKATSGKLISAASTTVIKGISIDSRKIKKDEAFIAIKGDNFDGHDFIDAAIKKGASCIIGLRPTSYELRAKIPFIQVQDTLRALGQIARFQRNKFDVPVIALTGSNGKTTTKEMMAWVLAGKFAVLKNEGTKNNQIGLPLTLLNLTQAHDIAVLEIGTNHFGEVEYLAKICQPNIGIITNIGYAHLEYFRDLNGVFREKTTLIKNLNNPYIGILNADDHLLKRLLSRNIKKPFTVGIGIKNKTDFFASDIRRSCEKLEFSVNQKVRFTLNTPGYFNIYNALGVIAVARVLGIEYKAIAKRLAEFDFPQGRLKITTFGQAKFIDDSYNSNPVSLEQALNTLQNLKTRGRKIFIMGDMLELGRRKKIFHSQAGISLKDICDIFISVGELSRFTAESAKRNGFAARCIFNCESSAQARDLLLHKLSLKKDDVVLIKGSRLMKMEEVMRS